MDLLGRGVHHRVDWCLVSSGEIYPPVLNIQEECRHFQRFVRCFGCNRKNEKAAADDYQKGKRPDRWILRHRNNQSDAEELE
jgi:hypothetical protein